MSLATLDDGRILEVNESFVELTGYTRPELIGRMSIESVWEMPLSRSELIRQIREQGVVRNLEARLRIRNGYSRLVLLSTLMVEIDDQWCLLSVSNDITELRRAEDGAEAAGFDRLQLVEPSPRGSAPGATRSSAPTSR